MTADGSFFCGSVHAERNGIASAPKKELTLTPTAGTGEKVKENASAARSATREAKRKKTRRDDQLMRCADESASIRRAGASA